MTDGPVIPVPRRRRLGCAGTIWGALAGAALGYAAAAVVDLLTAARWQGLWTLAFVAPSTVAVPLILAWMVHSGRTTQERLTRERKRLWRLREPASMLACLCALYGALWIAGPAMTGETAWQFGFVGVVAWPMLAGTVRVMLGLSPLKPRWWSVLWMFLGAAPATAILWLRAAHVANWFTGVVAGVAILIPIAVWRYRRAAKPSSPPMINR